MRGHGQSGQSSGEYLGVLLLVAVVVAAVLATGIGGSIATRTSELVCQIGGGNDCGEQAAGPADAGGGDDAARAAALADREAGLAGFAGEGGEGLQGLLGDARLAREAGDLDEAEALLDRLELYRGLVAGGRGSLVEDLLGGEADFDDLVADGTIDMGDTNRRYFELPPSPGDGVLVMDFFIPTGSSGFVLTGDGREAADPLLADLGLDDSRVTLVIDRESGRAVITQTETCTVAVVEALSICQAPRPIDLRTPESDPQIFPGDANEFDVSADEDSFSLSYDALNSITPGGLSVDGGVTFERGEDGLYQVREGSDTRDPYPEIVTYHYRSGEDPEQIDRAESQRVIPGALPQEVRDLPGQIADLPCKVPPILRGPAGILVC